MLRPAILLALLASLCGWLGADKAQAVVDPVGDLRIVTFFDGYDPALGAPNGVFDAAMEEFMGGWSVLVSGPSHPAGILVKTLGDTGSPDFGTALLTGLASGSYEVSELVQAGWTITVPNPLQIDILAGETTSVYIGNYAGGGDRIGASFAPVPEPTSAALLLLGGAGLLARRRRTRA